MSAINNYQEKVLNYYTTITNIDLSVDEVEKGKRQETVDTGIAHLMQLEKCRQEVSHISDQTLTNNIDTLVKKIDQVKGRIIDLLSRIPRQSLSQEQYLHIASVSQGFIHFYTDHTDPFTGFLGNFHDCKKPFEFGGLHFKNAEGCFQAQKTFNKHEQEQFQNVDGDTAFKLGRKVTLRQDWDNKKDEAMLNVLRAKFHQNPELKNLLLATGKAYLVEHNEVPGRDSYWSDNFDGTGQNKLGTLLMVLRGEMGGTGIVPKPSLCDQILYKNQQTSSSTQPSSQQKTYTCAFNSCPETAKSGFKFCSRTHGQNYIQMYGVEPCKLDGCSQPRYKELNGKVHEYCGRTHAQLASQY